MRSRAVRIVGRIGIYLLRALWVSTMVLTPLFGFWLASSLAAYNNASQWLSLLVGLLLFPILPVGWDLWFVWRMRKQPERKRYLTRLDRLVLRTLVINGAFLAIMLGTRASTAFHALAVRGDWILDGHHGPIAEAVRGRLLGLADRLDRRHRSGGGDYGESDDAPDPTQVRRDDDLPTPPPVDPTTGAPPRDPSGWPVDATIDPVVAVMPADVQGSIADVGGYLAEHVPDPRARVKAVHDYVVQRVTYDDATLAKLMAHDYDNVPSQGAEVVFASRTGVCEGYARLSAALGKAAGVEIAYIVGNARAPLSRAAGVNPDDPWSGSVSFDGYGHAWNAARIDGWWYLFDATWDDGADVYGTTYFLTPPALFVLDHLPDESTWQLLADPLSAGDFVRQPAMRAHATTLGIALREPTRSQVTVDGSIDIVIDNPYGAALITTVTVAGDDNPDHQRHCNESEEGSQVRFRCDRLGDGEYEVSIFGAPRGGETLGHVGSVWVNSH